MKKLLNSPLFVGAIALIALGVVAMNVIRPMMGSRRPTPEAVSVKKVIPVENHENKADQPAVAKSPDEVADRNKIRWRKKPAIRDPFKAKAPVSRKKQRKAPMAQFHLYGIWVEPGVRFAAINDEIVSEGDRIGEYRVAEIKPDSVLLKGPKDSRLLKF